MTYQPQVSHFRSRIIECAVGEWRTLSSTFTACVHAGGGGHFEHIL